MHRLSTPDPPPDFCIVGAPKCGTTALFTWLSEHPGIAMSRRKEPCFWSPDVDRLNRITGPAAYESLWGRESSGKLRGEASTAYLESHVAIPAILVARPQARFIAMVRNPVEMAAARHSDLVRRYVEDVGNFERAWRLQGARRRGEKIPALCREPGSLQYLQGTLIGDMLERFFANVAADQRLVILFDELVASPEKAYATVVRFLGLQNDGRTEFPRLNANQNLRSPAFARWHRSLPDLLGRYYDPARAIARKIGFSPSAAINRVNVRKVPRKPLTPSFESELIAVYAPQIRMVERLLHQDLSHWMRPAPR